MSDIPTDNQVDQADIVDTPEQSDDSGTLSSTTRRGALTAVAGLGLLGMADTTAAASGDHLGEVWRGSPGGSGLNVQKEDGGAALVALAGINTNNNGDVGISGFTDSSNGKALSGHARSESGSTRGLTGRVDSPDGTALQGRVTATGTGTSYGVEARTQAKDGIALRAKAFSSGTTYAVKGEVDSPDGYGLYTPNNAKIDGDLEVGGSVQNTLNVNSDLQVTGTKNFVQAVDTTAGTKNVHYTSIEAGEVRTEHTGVAELEDGHILIELPEHFDMVTSDEESLAVQVTAHAEEKVHPQVVDKSTRYVSVEDFSDGPDDYSISYTVKGIRAGFEDEDVVRDA